MSPSLPSSLTPYQWIWYGWWCATDVVQLRNIGGRLQKRLVSLCECLQGSCTPCSIEICVVQVRIERVTVSDYLATANWEYALGIKALQPIAVVENERGWGYRSRTKRMSWTSGDDRKQRVQKRQLNSFRHSDRSTALILLPITSLKLPRCSFHKSTTWFIHPGQGMTFIDSNAHCQSSSDDNTRDLAV